MPRYLTLYGAYYKDERETAGNLYNLRRSWGFTTGDVAEKIGVSRQTYEKWENKKGFPSVDYAYELAKIYDVSIEYLFGYSDYTSIKNEKIGEHIGISDKAIKALQEWNDGDGAYTVDSRKWGKILSDIITHPRFNELLEKIHHLEINIINAPFTFYVGESDTPVTVLQKDSLVKEKDSCLYNASRIFANIIEEIVTLDKQTTRKRANKGQAEIQ